MEQFIGAKKIDTTSDLGKISQMRRSKSITITDKDGILPDNDYFKEEYAETRNNQNVIEKNETVSGKLKL